ncbi:MAG: hypothetical protein HZB38_09260 [Planctomycetes bacterium]|nr:hypothetical protein [Planctomycetota bacterium]
MFDAMKEPALSAVSRRGVAAFCILLGAASLASAQPNVRAARILGMFDIDGAGVPDQSPDSDGDGLPDSWESGGLDLLNTDVAFPAPQAIVPGTPSVSLFSRRPVRTSAVAFDSDGDGLSDFVEVFGLATIDDNHNGVLDDACARDAAGAVIRDANGLPVRLTCACLAAGTCFRLDENNNLVSAAPECAANFDALIGEWFDINGDGMPSIGEYPAVNTLISGAAVNFDYDGFVFTDPTNPDTDGDGLLDGIDNDPLVNPRSFGVDSDYFPSGTGSLAADRDKDNDGVGNGMDLGNDVDGNIDNPSDLNTVIALVRRDLLAAGVQRVPEGLLEDLLGSDWNGDGLFRLTDIQNPHFGVTAEPLLFAGGTNLFQIEDPANPAVTIRLGLAVEAFPLSFDGDVYFNAAARLAAPGAPLPFQDLLRPVGSSDNVFLPDPRIWTVLYAWRMPGVDVDGDGFIGYDSASFSGTVDINGIATIPANVSFDPSTKLLVAGATSTRTNGLDGVVAGLALPGLCPTLSLVSLIGLAGIGLRLTRANVQ